MPSVSCALAGSHLLPLLPSPCTYKSHLWGEALNEIHVEETLVPVLLAVGAENVISVFLPVCDPE